MSFVKTNIGVIILYTLGLILLFGLSLWQYQRGLEKQVIVKIQNNQTIELRSSTPESWASLHFREVQLSGQWMSNKAFLLENRIYKGQVGYEVLMPFKLDQDQAIILVNRGWVSQPEPIKLAPTSVNLIKGVIYKPDKGLVLGDAILPEQLTNSLWPKKSLYMDMNAFAQALGTKIQPIVLVLDQQDAMSYQRIWTAVVMSPAKHFGYAIQWLGLALTLTTYGVIWFRRRKT